MNLANFLCCDTKSFSFNAGLVGRRVHRSTPGRCRCTASRHRLARQPDRAGSPGWYLRQQPGRHAGGVGGQRRERSGRDLQGAGSVSVAAGRDVNLGTATTSSSQDSTWNADNYRRETESAEIGTTIKSAGLISIRAGQASPAIAATKRL